jgi:hypothetical protein
MTVDEIEYRIKAEYAKHKSAGLDWAKIAAIKIHAVLRDEPFKHKIEVIPTHEILNDRCSAYDFIDFDKPDTNEEGLD